MFNSNIGYYYYRIINALVISLRFFVDDQHPLAEYFDPSVGYTQKSELLFSREVGTDSVNIFKGLSM